MLKLKENVAFVIIKTIQKC